MSTFQIGDVRITRVVEIEMPTNPIFIYPQMVPEALVRHHSWLRPHFVNDEGRVIMAIQGFAVESEGARILVDTCVGNDKSRQAPFWNQLQLPWLERLSAAGFTPESIDSVLCTHLHVDHVGWNTRLESGRWVPTFPRARYLFGRDEWEHWRAAEPSEHLADSVWPVVQAGVVDLVASDHRLTGEVWLEPTPGHTPGHVSVRIESRGEQAVISGDVMHHPVQCAEPDWTCSFDSDPALAISTRRAFLERFADQPTLVLGTHFATPTAGRIRRDGSVWRFEV